MKKTLREPLWWLLLLILLLLTVLPAVSYISLCLPQRTLEAACSPSPDDCLTKLIVLAQKHPEAWNFYVQGQSTPPHYDDTYSQAFDHRWHYDRKSGVVVQYSVDSEFFGYKSEWTGGKLVYHGVTDALLQKFAKTTAPPYYPTEFKSFCKAQGCRVAVDDDLDRAIWSMWHQ